MRRAMLLVLSIGLGCSSKSGGGPADGGAPKPIPVQSGKVQKKDLPLKLEGLGSVTAYYTVTVRSRVDGELMKVAFLEGQQVKKGDLLVQIDARPYQIALEQAQAALQKDKAQLKDDQLDLDRDVQLLTQKLVAQQTVDDQRALA